MYGMSDSQIKYAREKIERTKLYLDNHFIEVGGKVIPLSDFHKNPVVNADRYIAEIQHRVWSLYRYAESRDLVNLFVTLTLPSEYHPTRSIKTKNGSKSVKNPKYIPDDAHDPKSGSLELSQMLKKLFDDRSYKDIPKEDRVYFRVTEPHKDGTPHLHISFFVPPEHVARLAAAINRLFPEPLAKVEANIQNPVAYLMKYILKTFDDLRYGDDKITELSLWYIYWGIGRFYTSRTLISLDVYRVLGGRYSLLRLTTMYRNREITVFLNDKGKVCEVYEDCNGIAYNRIYHKEEVCSYKPKETTIKLSLKPKPVKPIPIELENSRKKLFYKEGRVIEVTRPISHMKDLELYQYFKEIEHDYEVNPQHFALVHNEMSKRGYLDDKASTLNELVFEDFY